MEFMSITGPQRVKGRTVTGIAAVYDEPADNGIAGDIFMPGCFNGAGFSRVRYLWDAAMNQPPIATIKDIREVNRGQLPSEIRHECPRATGGLEITREYLNTERGNTALEAIKAGAVDGILIGFEATGEGRVSRAGYTYRTITYAVLMCVCDTLFRSSVGKSRRTITRGGMLALRLKIAEHEVLQESL